MPGLLVIMGSGETAPTMIKPHRSIFERVGDRPAVLIDTPYGFQSNAEDISSRAVGYFAASVGREVEVVSWRTTPPPGLQQERALATLREAGWVFAGPGSPTYALRQWRGTAIESAWAEVLARDGVVTLASAAALTLGSHTVPVYEIYKAGVDPYWEPGLDLVQHICGLPAVVIPHYDNAEGGHHDTRYCYLGEQRLSTMERLLPESSFILGVDEHTAVLLDPEARTAAVVGNGTMTVRRAGRSLVHPTGAVVTFEQLLTFDQVLAFEAVNVLAVAGAPVMVGDATTDSPTTDTPATDTPGNQSPGNDTRAGDVPTPPGDAAPPSLWTAAADISASFDTALAARDVDACVEAILALEQAIVDWSADTNVSDHADRARAHLRTMVIRLGALAAVGARDPRSVVGPFVEGLLEVRRRAREAQEWAVSDWVRDHLGAAGVEVRDTADGPRWQLSSVPTQLSRDVPEPRHS
jgi:cyanophycinase-like exopeptidase